MILEWVMVKFLKSAFIVFFILIGSGQQAMAVSGSKASTDSWSMVGQGKMVFWISHDQDKTTAIPPAYSAAVNQIVSTLNEVPLQVAINALQSIPGMTMFARDIRVNKLPISYDQILLTVSWLGVTPFLASNSPSPKDVGNNFVKILMQNNYTYIDAAIDSALQQAKDRKKILALTDTPPPPTDHSSTGKDVRPGVIYGEPVNLATGAYIYDVGLIQAAGSTSPFGFSMHYSSLVLSKDGKHWQHNYEWHLTENKDLSVKVKKGDGSSDYFNTPMNGKYIATYEKTYSSLQKVAGQGFVYKTKSNTVYYFNLKGQLITIVPANGDLLKGGQSERLTPNSNRQLLSVRDAKGNMAKFVYNQGGELSTVNYGDTVTISFTYDSHGNLIKLVDANQASTRFTYNEFGDLLTITDAEGVQTLKNTYNAKHQVIEQLDAENAKTTYAYSSDSSTHQTVVYDRLGREFTKVFDLANNLIIDKDGLGNKTEYLYDWSGNLTQHTNSLGKKFSQKFDNQGNLVSRIDATGNETVFSYDTNHNLLSIKKPSGHQAFFTYDAKGNLLSKTDFMGHKAVYTYNAKSQLIKLMNALGDIVKFSYDDYGNILSKTDSLGNVTRYSYDVLGNVLSTTLPSGVVSKFTYDKAAHLISRTDALGYQQKFKYNRYGKLIAFTDANGNQSHYAYNKIRKLSSITDALGNTTQYSYDAEGNRIAMKDAQSNQLMMKYDAINQLVSIQDPLKHITQQSYDVAGRLVSVTDSLNHQKKMAYDDAGRLLKVTNNLGGSTSQKYNQNGDLNYLTDQLGRTIHYWHDFNGVNVRTTDPMDVNASVELDAMGHVRKLIDRKGNVTSYQYNAIGQLVSEVDQNGHRTKLSYNNNGLLISRLNADNKEIKYSYDKANRLIKVLTPTETIKYTLDANENRLEISSSISGSVKNVFDALNRIIKRVDPLGNVLAYAYDSIGNMVQLTYPDGKQVHYNYDANHRMVKVADWDDRITKYQYLGGTGLVSMASLPDGSMRNYTYDAANRLVALSDKTSAGDVIYSVQYTLDAAGQRIAADESLPLASKFKPSEIKYSYDHANQIVSSSDAKYEYDNAGNMIAQIQGETSTKLAYNTFGKLLSRGTTSYMYDAEGLRIKRTVNGASMHYVQSPVGNLTQVVMEQDESGKGAAWNVYGMGLISRQYANGSLSYYHYNALGSTMALSDASGEVTDTYAYNSYGQQVGHTGSTMNPYTMHGKWGVEDEGESLYYMRARYYDANIKRFISRDNIFTGVLRRPNTLNRHVFVEGNPISYIDPKGDFFFLAALVPVAETVWAGALISGGMEVVTQVVDVGKMNWKKVRGNSVVGGFASLNPVSRAVDLAKNVVDLGVAVKHRVDTFIAPDQTGWGVDMSKGKPLSPREQRERNHFDAQLALKEGRSYIAPIGELSSNRGK